MNAELRSLAVAFPSMRRSNAYFQKHHPQSVRSAGDKVLDRVWNADHVASNDPWTAEMGPYLTDPFRGAVERRWLAPGETALELELRAAKQALDAAGLRAADIDLAIVSSFQPDNLGVGNAAFLASTLGLKGSAFNVESACSSALVSLQLASSLISAGQHRNVLVVASCTYSRSVAETDSLAWSIGDGACAFVVSRTDTSEGFLSFEVVHTGQTCGAMFYEPEVMPDNSVSLRMRAGKTASRSLREAAEWAVERCCVPALKKANATLSDVRFFATTTPVAWYAKFAGRVLGYPASKTFNSHPLYANTGPILMPQNLFHGAKEGLIRPGDLVLLQTVGSVSSAGAAVLRWGNVGLGPMPEKPRSGE